MIAGGASCPFQNAKDPAAMLPENKRQMNEHSVCTWYLAVVILAIVYVCLGVLAAEFLVSLGWRIGTDSGGCAGRRWRETTQSKERG